MAKPLTVEQYTFYKTQEKPMPDTAIMKIHGLNNVQMNLWKHEHDLVGKKFEPAVKTSAVTSKQAEPLREKKVDLMQTIEEYEAKKTKDRLETKQRLKELSEMEIPAEQPKQQIVSIQTEPKAEPLSSAPVEVEPPATESHYSRNGIDVIGFAEMQFAPEELKGFYRINILKYVTRYDRKQDALGDLEKAASYLEKLIELEDSK